MSSPVANADGTLFPNQFANIRLQLDTIEGATAVPGTAVQRGAQGIFRFTSQLPEWTADSSERGRPYTTVLAGVQEVLTD